MAQTDEIGSSFIAVGGTSLDAPLQELLVCDQIQPGSQPSYELCKTIYLYHPLGGKMADGPINIAQSQAREIACQEAPEEVAEAFEEEWEAIGADSVIHNVVSLSRIYGISSFVMLVDGQGDNSPLNMEKAAERDIAFNVFDPLNTSGSLILNQVPTARDFNKPLGISVNGTRYHPSRTLVMMNEAPIYISYTSSGFGFVGRSVYQRALFPLKSFIRTMILNDMIATKGGTIVVKQKAPGSIINRGMQIIAGIKRNFVKQAQTNNVIQIDVEEEVASIDLNNVDKAGTFARSNIIRDCETACDMPAKMLDQETMVSGFGEGSEDARRCAQYIERFRTKIRPPYKFFDNVVQYRAWTPAFYERMRKKYKGEVPATFADAFSQWRENFSATWPSLLIEPESEQIKVEETKLKGITDLMAQLLPVLDPENKANFVQQCLDNVNENKRMFTRELAIDLDLLLDHAEESAELEKEAAATDTEATATTAKATLKKASQPPKPAPKPAAKPAKGK